MTAFGISYLISPRFCHRFVGYLEEEAVKTYTKCLQVSLEVVILINFPIKWHLVTEHLQNVLSRDQGL